MENKTLLELVQSLVKSNEDIKNQIADQQTVITNEIRVLKQEIFEDVLEIKKENKALREEVKELKEKLEKVERDSKRYRLIIHGLEEEKDDCSDLERTLDLINRKLGVECRFADVRNFVRLGQPLVEKRRTASLELNSFFLKREILKNSKKLKGTNIFISPDYTEKERAEQKLLYHHLKEARLNSKQAFIKNKVLVIDGRKRTLEELKENTQNIQRSIQDQRNTEGIKEQGPAQDPINCNKRKAPNEDTSQPPKRNLRSTSVSSK